MALAVPCWGEEKIGDLSAFSSTLLSHPLNSPSPGWEVHIELPRPGTLAR